MLFRDYFFIKLHIYTWKSRVQTGVNRCKWVRMGADGCVRVQGAQEAQKQGKQRQKWSCMTFLHQNKQELNRATNNNKNASTQQTKLFCSSK